jgi:hypothetical protein
MPIAKGKKRPKEDIDENTGTHRMPLPLLQFLFSKN